MKVVYKLDNIYDRAKELVNENEHLKEENSSLRQENELLSKEVQELKTQVQVLENKKLNLQTAEHIVNTNNKKEIKQQIDHYIRDIDRCIEKLKR